MHGTIVALLLGLIHTLDAAKTDKVCEPNYCKLPQSNVSAKALNDFCAGGLTSSGRCCLNATTTTLLGVDLSNCELANFPKDSEFSDATKLQWLAVNQNNNLTVHHSNLRFFRALNTLIVESGKGSCNGSFSNVTTLDDATHTQKCEAPTDGCTGVTCPMHSHCAPDGPGLNMCLCDQGWNSYRCLKKEGFPVIQWIAGFSVTTIVICVSLKVAQKKSIAKARASAQTS